MVLFSRVEPRERWTGCVPDTIRSSAPIPPVKMSWQSSADSRQLRLDRPTGPASRSVGGQRAELGAAVLPVRSATDTTSLHARGRPVQTLNTPSDRFRLAGRGRNASARRPTKTKSRV